MFSSLLCYVGIHKWLPWIYVCNTPTTYICDRCGKVKKTKHANPIIYVNDNGSLFRT